MAPLMGSPSAISDQQFPGSLLDMQGLSPSQPSCIRISASLGICVAIQKHCGNYHHAGGKAGQSNELMLNHMNPLTKAPYHLVDSLILNLPNPPLHCLLIFL